MQKASVAVVAVLLVGGAASSRILTTPSPTPDPCAWQSVSENTGWDFGDRDGDGRADYFRWASPELVQLTLRATGASFTHFPRDALHHAVGPALGVAYFVCQVRDAAPAPAPPAPAATKNKGKEKSAKAGGSSAGAKHEYVMWPDECGKMAQKVPDGFGWCPCGRVMDGLCPTGKCRRCDMAKSKTNHAGAGGASSGDKRAAGGGSPPLATPDDHTEYVLWPAHCGSVRTMTVEWCPCGRVMGGPHGDCPMDKCKPCAKASHEYVLWPDKCGDMAQKVPNGFGWCPCGRVMDGLCPTAKCRRCDGRGPRSHARRSASNTEYVLWPAHCGSVETMDVEWCPCGRVMGGPHGDCPMDKCEACPAHYTHEYVMWPAACGDVTKHDFGWCPCGRVMDGECPTGKCRRCAGGGSHSTAGVPDTSNTEYVLWPAHCGAVQTMDVEWCPCGRVMGGPARDCPTDKCRTCPTRSAHGAGGKSAIDVRVVCAAPCTKVAKRMLAAARKPGLAQSIALRLAARLRDEKALEDQVERAAGGSAARPGQPKARAGPIMLQSLGATIIPAADHAPGATRTPLKVMTRAEVAAAPPPAPPSHFPVVVRDSGQQAWSFGAAENLLLERDHWMVPVPRGRLQWVIFDLGRPRSLQSVTLDLFGNDGNPRSCWIQAGDAPDRVSSLVRILVPSASSTSVTATVPVARRTPPHRYYRLFILDNWGAEWGVGFNRIRFLCDDGSDCSYSTQSTAMQVVKAGAAAAAAVVAAAVLLGAGRARRNAGAAMMQTQAAVELQSQYGAAGAADSETSYQPLPATAKQ